MGRPCNGRPVFEVIVMQEAAQRAIEQKLKGEKEQVLSASAPEGA